MSSPTNTVTDPAGPSTSIPDGAPSGWSPEKPIVVFTRAGCPGCRATEQKADKLGLPYVMRDVGLEPDALEYVKQLGYLQAPVVAAHIGGETVHWSGFRPDRLAELSEQLRALPAPNAGEPQLDYRTVLTLDRVDQLTLGVSGRSASANARRLEIAEAIAAERLDISDRAYRQAHWSSEPHVPEPFGLTAVIAARGDLNAVVSPPKFLDLVNDAMGNGYRQEIVSDEDGTRWESFAPTAADLAAAKVEADRIRTELVDRGAVPTTVRALTGDAELQTLSAAMGVTANGPASIRPENVTVNQEWGRRGNAERAVVAGPQLAWVADRTSHAPGEARFTVEGYDADAVRDLTVKTYGQVHADLNRASPNGSTLSERIGQITATTQELSPGYDAAATVGGPAVTR